MDETRQDALAQILARLDRVDEAIERLSGDLRSLGDRVEMVPRQVRQLGTKVDDLTESISHPRMRDLLTSLLVLLDLVDQMGSSAEPAAYATNCKVLHDQIVQVLRVNGVNPIADTSRFDPFTHRAVATIACATPNEDGEILQVHRTGFRTERAVLRFAEVTVKRYGPS
jgi:molecular chaperone GrpE (heat shock protein)